MGGKLWDGVLAAESCFIRRHAVFQIDVFVAYIAIKCRSHSQLLKTSLISVMPVILSHSWGDLSVLLLYLYCKVKNSKS